jgi:DNA-binding CsgD family transcriptional regulator
MSLDRAKLAKIMEMTKSPEDNERLTAIAKANAMLMKERQTWTSLLASAGEGPSPAPDKPTYNETMAPNVPGRAGDGKWDKFAKNERDIAVWILRKRSSFDFAESLYHNIRKYGALTSRQREAAERCMARDNEELPPGRQTPGRGKVRDPYPDNNDDDDVPF